MLSDQDLQRALDDFEYRELMYSHATAFMLRVGFYSYDHYETVDSYDWAGGPVAVGQGGLLRAAVPPDPAMAFAEYAHLLELGFNACVIVAEHPSTPIDVLVRLARHEKFEVQRAALGNVNATKEVRRAASMSESSSVRHAVAVDPRTEPDIIDVLAGDADPYIRISVTYRRDLSPTVLQRLALDLPSTMASHPQTTVDMLVAIAEIPDAWEALACNPRTPPEVLTRLARAGTTWRLRNALVKNGRTPDEALAVLIDEESKAPSSKSDDILVSLAQRALPEVLSLRLAAHPDQKVLWTLAEHTTSQAALSQLATSSNTLVRQYVAKNPHHQRDLESLALDPMSPVREALAKRSDLPFEIAELLAADSQKVVRMAVARHGPESLLTKLAQDEDADVRRECAIRAAARKA